MNLLDLIHRTSFLGQEFLTWLWYRSDQQGGVFNLGGEHGEIEAWFDDRLVISSLAVDAQENLFKGGHPTTSAEAMTALQKGKKASEAKLRVIKGAKEWSFILKADNLAVGSVKIPAVLSKEYDDKFYERMMLLEELDQMVKALFKQFLLLRVSPEWEGEEIPAIQSWVAAGTTEA